MGCNCRQAGGARLSGVSAWLNHHVCSAGALGDLRRGQFKVISDSFAFSEQFYSSSTVSSINQRVNLMQPGGLKTERGGHNDGDFQLPLNTGHTREAGSLHGSTRSEGGDALQLSANVNRNSFVFKGTRHLKMMQCPSCL